jgi:glycosyltransferase involved in cell wall biosynthesis
MTVNLCQSLVLRFLQIIKIRSIIQPLDKRLSLVLPCYKPEAGWTERVLYYYKTIQKTLPETELYLIIVNDGAASMSLDEEIQKLQLEIEKFSYYSYQTNKGKGYALRYGIARAVTLSVIYTDIDFPYTTESVCSVAGLLENNDVVIGIKSNAYYKSVPFLRKRISKWLQRMISFFFPAIITTDTQCGLKGLKGKAKDIFLATQINNYLFDLEFIVSISNNPDISATVKEVQLRDNVKFGGISVFTLFRELLNFFKIIFTRKLFGPKK